MRNFKAGEQWGLSNLVNMRELQGYSECEGTWGNSKVGEQRGIARPGNDRAFQSYCT